jgi:hypothetical protein
MTIALLKQYRSFHGDASLLELFPRLEIMSIANDVDGPRFVDAKRAGVSIYQQNLRVTLFKAVTLDDIQSLPLQFRGNGNDGCICFFGTQLKTSLKSGWIRVSHITHLTICPGAGIVASSAVKDGVGARDRGLQFQPTESFGMQIQEPSNDLLVRSTVSLVLDLARVAKYGTIDLQCESRVLEIYIEIVSSHSWLPLHNAHIVTCEVGLDRNLER